MYLFTLIYFIFIHSYNRVMRLDIALYIYMILYNKLDIVDVTKFKRF